MKREAEVDTGADAGNDEEATATVGHNSGETLKPQMTEDQLAALFFQHKRRYEDALAIKKEADADLRNICKIAKAEMGPTAVLAIKDAIQLETEEGEAEIRARMELTLKVAGWMGASLGSQLDMFAADHAIPADERAHKEGRHAGFIGDPAKSPYAPELPQHEAWMKGWQIGSKALIDIQRSQDEGLFEEVEEGQ